MPLGQRTGKPRRRSMLGRRLQRQRRRRRRTRQIQRAAQQRRRLQTPQTLGKLLMPKLAQLQLGKLLDALGPALKGAVKQMLMPPQRRVPDGDEGVRAPLPSRLGICDPEHVHDIQIPRLRVAPGRDVGVHAEGAVLLALPQRLDRERPHAGLAEQRVRGHARRNQRILFRRAAQHGRRGRVRHVVRAVCAAGPGFRDGERGGVGGCEARCEDCLRPVDFTKVG